MVIIFMYGKTAVLIIKNIFSPPKWRGAERLRLHPLNLIRVMPA